MMVRKPFGEARRLRYLSFICDSLYKRNETDEFFFIDLCLNNIKKLNVSLKNYIRTTGIMQTHAVMRNYISYCKWLNLLNKESNILYPNSYTIYFGLISNNNNFSLTSKEKLSYYAFLTKKIIFKYFLENLKIRSTPIDYINGDIDEHRSETFLEWCVDLGILHSNSRKFGKYTLYSQFVNLPKKVRNSSNEELLKEYFSKTLNRRIIISSDVPDDVLWREAMISLNKTYSYTRSEIDENLYSALPMIFDLQIELVIKMNRLIPFRILIKKIEKLALLHDSLFKWDYLADGGFIQLEV